MEHKIKWNSCFRKDGNVHLELEEGEQFHSLKKLNLLA
jgi:hypothetical protein